jgi:hypothetical protein
MERIQYNDIKLSVVVLSVVLLMTSLSVIR